ncbi:MAG: HNH endonuclease [Acidimicrobiales bacterium]
MTERNDWLAVREELTPELRRKVIWRDMGKCVVCLTWDTPHIDHIIPVSLGGQSIIFNLWTLCAKHNREKGAQWPTFWAAKIVSQYGSSLSPFWHYQEIDGDPFDNDGCDRRRPLVLSYLDIAMQECGIEPGLIAKTSAIESAFPGYAKLSGKAEGHNDDD